MTRRNNPILVAAVLLLVLAGGGCKKEATPPSPPPPQQKPAQPAKPPVQSQASSAKPVASVAPSIDFASRKDPFKPFIQPKVEKVAPRPSLSSAGLLPIQSFGVEQFRVSGIIVGLKENKALIVDPSGKGYVVKEGMSIGNNNGVITKISPASIDVAERFRDDTGKVTKRTVKLSLPKKN
ncbi:MAG: pilus assembly protein PilP [Desulfuromonadales bacterium]|nr:MAG: pilus assembly protein PilP [Desulfuromonadales bacterium]